MSPHLKELDLDSLGDLAGGQSAGIVGAAMRAALRDTEDRGADKKARKVTITIEFKKVGADHIDTTVKATTSLPPYVTEPTRGAIHMNGTRAEVLFNPSSPGNPEQAPIPGTV